MLFLLVLRYVQPHSEVERHLEAHREFLRRHYASGTFLLSGPQEPRTGGVILAQAPDRLSIDAIAHSDPFYRYAVASYEVIAWRPNLRATDLESGLFNEVRAV